MAAAAAHWGTPAEDHWKYPARMPSVPAWGGGAAGGTGTGGAGSSELLDLESSFSFFSTKRPSKLENGFGALEAAGKPGLPRLAAEPLAAAAAAVARKAAS